MGGVCGEADREALTCWHCGEGGGEREGEKDREREEREREEKREETRGGGWGRGVGGGGRRERERERGTERESKRATGRGRDLEAPADPVGFASAGIDMGGDLSLAHQHPHLARELDKAVVRHLPRQIFARTSEGPGAG